MTRYLKKSLAFTIVTFIFTFIQAIWFFVVLLAGEDIGISYGQGVQYLNAKGQIATAIIFGTSFLLQIIHIVVNNKQRKQKHYEEAGFRVELYEKMIKGMNEIQNQKDQDLRTHVATNINGKTFARIITNPRSKLDTLSKKIEGTILKCAEENVGIVTTTLAYRMQDYENAWGRWENVDLSSDVKDPGELAQDIKSTFHSVVNGKSFRFYNDKRVGYKEDRYSGNENDTGSIMCWYVPVIISEKTYAEAVFSLSTKKQFLKSNKKKEKKLEEVLETILAKYEKILKCELLFFYIEKMNSFCDNDLR